MTNELHYSGTQLSNLNNCSTDLNAEMLNCVLTKALQFKEKIYKFMQVLPDAWHLPPVYVSLHLAGRQDSLTLLCLPHLLPFHIPAVWKRKSLWLF